MSNKSDFILKIPTTCINYIFRNQSMFLKIKMFGKHIKESINLFIQWFSMLISDPVIHCCGNMSSRQRGLIQSFPIDLAGVHLVRLWMVCKEFTFIIIRNVLLLSLSSVLILNELQRRSPKSLFNDILHCSDAMYWA